MTRTEITKRMIFTSLWQKTTFSYRQLSFYCNSNRIIRKSVSSLLTRTTQFQLICHDHYKQIFSSLFPSLTQKRSFDAFSVLVIPSVFLFSLFKSWQLKRDAFIQKYGTVICTQDFGNVQYNIIDTQKVLGDNTHATNNNKIKVENQDIVLFFHDVPGSCDQYAAISAVTSFQLPCPVISISRPGYLGTDIYQRQTLSDINQLFRWMLENQLHLIDSSNQSSNRIHLLALGKGGMYALHFAHTFPHLTSSLILMSSATRRDGYRFQFRTYGDAEYMEDKMLEMFLSRELKSRRRYLPDIIEMMNTQALKRGTKKAYETAFGQEYTPNVRDMLAPELAELYSASTQQFFPIDITRNSDEFAFHLLRTFGQGDVYKNRYGTINDLCNICKVEVDLQKKVKMTLASIEDIIKRIQKEGEINADMKQEKLNLVSYKDIQEYAEIVENYFHNTSAVSQKKHVSSTDVNLELVSVNNGKYLSEIRCPTLILHSPDDGKIEYNFHAVHANQYIPNSELEIFEAFPHTLPLKDPRRLEATIARFISSIRKKQINA